MTFLLSKSSRVILQMKRNFIFSSMSTKRRTFYEVLELSENCSGEDIKKAYIKLSKKNHPDTANESELKGKHENFVAIGEAYATLSKEESRREYDESINRQRVPPPRYTRPPHQGPHSDRSPFEEYYTRGPGNRQRSSRNDFERTRAWQQAEHFNAEQQRMYENVRAYERTINRKENRPGGANYEKMIRVRRRMLFWVFVSYILLGCVLAKNTQYNSEQGENYYPGYPQIGHGRYPGPRAGVNTQDIGRPHGSE